MLTSDPNHPDLKRYTGPEKPGPQHSVYLVLSEEERAKGFVRPYREVYVHVGKKPKYPLDPLTEEQKKEYADQGWIFYEKYPEGSPEAKRGSLGRYWSQKDLDTGCG